MKVSVRDMRNGHFRTSLILILILLILIPLGCAASDQQMEYTSMKAASKSKDIAAEDVVHLIVDGGSYVSSLNHDYQISWHSGMTVADALKTSGVVKLHENQDAVVSVSDVSLDPSMGFSIKLNNKELEIPQQLNKTIYANDKLVIFVEKVKVESSKESKSEITISLKGNKENANKMLTFVIPWPQTAKISVLLDQFGPVKLSTDGSKIISIWDEKISDPSDVRITNNGKVVSTEQLKDTDIAPNSKLTIEWNPMIEKP